jgi:tetratricopeptide (TPR) repeat protein
MPGGRRWLLRGFALTVVPLLLLAGLELILRAIGFGDSPHFFLRSRIREQSVYVENQEFTRRFFPPHLVRNPQPCWMEADKPRNAFRIFILGESAAIGAPEPSFGFGRVLEVLLRERFPGVKVEVINTAITAINSHVILPIARDCAPRQGDVWVIYMGNNEVVGPYGAGTVFGAQTPNLAFIRATLAFKATRIGQLFSAIQERLGHGQGVPAGWGGMKMFLNQQVRKDDPRMERVYANFHRNLRAIVRTATDAGARVVLCTVASNLKDCAPFASSHRAELTASQLTDWDREYRAGIADQEAARCAAALEHFQKAASIDPTYADLAYHMGHCALELRHPEWATNFFEVARDQDTLRFRADTRLNQIITETATARRKHGVFLLDAVKVMADHSPDGLPGEDLFYEHVHLTFAGNYWLGRAVADRIGEWIPRQWISGPAPDRLLTLEECARRLVLTDWDQYQAVEVMVKQMREPPFTNQSDWPLRIRRWQERLDQLRAQLTPSNFQSTLEWYRTELTRAPADVYLRNRYGRLLELTGHESEAIDQFARSLEEMPHDAQTYVYLAYVLDHRGQAEHALACLRQALRIRSEFPEAWNDLGFILAKQGQDSEAIRCYQQAIRLNPESAERHVNLGVAYFHLSKLDEAIAEYDEALRLNSNSFSAYLNLGNVLFKQGRLPEAVERYSAAVKLAPQNPVAHLNLAEAYAQLHGDEQARQQFQEVLRIDPNNAEARRGLEGAAAPAPP